MTDECICDDPNFLCPACVTRTETWLGPDALAGEVAIWHREHFRVISGGEQ
jgi:hypothetical protein